MAHKIWVIEPFLRSRFSKNSSMASGDKNSVSSLKSGPWINPSVRRMRLDSPKNLILRQKNLSREMSNSSTGESFFLIFTKIKVQTLLLFANRFGFWVTISRNNILEFSIFWKSSGFNEHSCLRFVSAVHVYGPCLGSAPCPFMQFLNLWCPQVNITYVI